MTVDDQDEAAKGNDTHLVRGIQWAELIAVTGVEVVPALVRLNQVNR